MTRAPFARLVAAATLVVAAAVVLGPTTPASAASCTSGSGVTVVVDPGALGGALTAACDGGSGQAASARYADVGVAISYVQRQPGFVCRVNGVPATDPCVNTPPADAYWGLWWTDGESGTWSYSSIGVTGLQVPEGGAVALAWQQGGTRRTPGLAARARGARAEPHQGAHEDPHLEPDPDEAPHEGADVAADLVRSGVALGHPVEQPVRPRLAEQLGGRVGERVRDAEPLGLPEPQPAAEAAGHADAVGGHQQPGR